MVELLSIRLADDSLARSVDAGAVIGAWRTAGLAPAMDVPRDTVVRLAARLGAERVVVGGVIGTRTHLVVRATVLLSPRVVSLDKHRSKDRLTALPPLSITSRRGCSSRKLERRSDSAIG